MSNKAARVFCSKCKTELWKVSVKPKEVTIYLTCSRCGKTQVIKLPTAKQILERSPEVVKAFIKKAVRDAYNV